jgi:hypothetical protein
MADFDDEAPTLPRKAAPSNPWKVVARALRVRLTAETQMRAAAEVENEALRQRVRALEEANAALSARIALLGQRR